MRREEKCAVRAHAAGEASPWPAITANVCRKRGKRGEEDHGGVKYVGTRYVMHPFCLFGTAQVTEDGCEVLTARLPSSPKVFDWLTP